MAAAGEEDNSSAVLSDVEEEEDNPPDNTAFHGSSSRNVSIEKFREVVAELDRERKTRQSVENSKSELQNSFNRLKALAHESIRKRDEISRQLAESVKEKDELVKQKADLVKQLEESVKAKDTSRSEKDELVKQKADLVKRLEESVKTKDSSKSEMETAAQMLVTGIEKVSGKVSSYKSFAAAGGLPRSKKYNTGLPAVAYGVIKRSNDITEELLRQIESANKSRNEAREELDRRNYEIAIEVSRLEEEASKRDNVVEGLEKSVAEKDGKISNLETELLGMRELASDSGAKVKDLERMIDSQRPLLADQLDRVSKLHEQILGVVKMLDDDDKKKQSDLSDLSDSLFLPRETDVEENIRACLAGLESVSELISVVYEKIRDLVVERNREVKSLNESVTQLVREKEHVGSLLRSALSRRMSSKTNEVFRVAEIGLRESGIQYRFSNHTSDGTASDSNTDAGNLDNKDDEIYALAGALENIIKQSQLEIIELQHTVDELRAETSLLKENAEAQAKELIQRKEQVEKLKDKERVANENVEGLMMDIAAAEEEITRWKVAAQQEAEAGRAIEQEYVAQLSTLRQALEEAKKAVMESEKKLKFKEQTAGAAMAARDAAERSLRLADSRATRLRDRVEELTRQLEQPDTRETSSGSQSGPRYVCWPWQWLGLNAVGSHNQRVPDMQPLGSNEMELSEPLVWS